ncbi:MAG: LapA family protein [Synergistaceae bacterium]|nr:LapA family protein [Synergistaceae bacterium]
MKSYILAITITMFLSALFAFQNIGDVTVRFLMFEWVFPQGVWEVLVFCTGAAIMWIFSIFSMFEMRGKYKKELKAKDERIAAVENEKKMILESMAVTKNSGFSPDTLHAPYTDGESQITGLAD